ncbi:InlB B-repeat-containing protein [Butyrivibrio sp. AD3002]|uniref:InlB B-repeat-containing protein n=1 Tax=Butyrivibrio sp. AD3002 TaxID=1280670 RepID=UPI0003B33E7B|nr:InlB B-repeat-containing protein [Butyrivibrio sp. AD3002]
MNINTFKRKSIILAAAVCAASLFLPINDYKIEAKAETNISANFPTNDIPELPEPEVKQLETVDKGALGIRPRNMPNLNSGVKTGLHYTYLDDTEKKLYRALIAACDHVAPYETENISIDSEYVIPLVLNSSSKFSYTTLQYHRAVYAAKYDHCDLVQLQLCSIHFYWQITSYGSSTKLYNHYVYLKSEVPSYDQAKFNQMTAELQAKRRNILSDSSVQNAAGIIGKELAVHDKLIDINTYDYECANTDNHYDIGQTAYGALVKGTSVCEGYAMGLVYLLEGIDVDSMVVIGNAGGLHAWNIVKIDGSWYETDPTWDDYEPESSRPEEFVRERSHAYYHLTTVQITAYKKTISAGGYRTVIDNTHIRTSESENYPEATATKYSYENVKKIVGGEGTEVSNVPVTGVNFLSDKLKVSKGTTGTLDVQIIPSNATDKTLFYESSDDEVITVDQSGNYTALVPGYATITVRTPDGKNSSSIEVAVSDESGKYPVKSLQLSANSVKGYVGDQGILTCTFESEDPSKNSLIWTTSDSDVVSIEDLGEGKARYTINNSGYSTVEVKSDDGKCKATCNFNASIRQVKVTLDYNYDGIKRENTLYYGEKYGYTLSGCYRDGYNFEGWYTDRTGGERVTSSSTVSVKTEHTLYARWKVQAFTMYFYTGSGRFPDGTSTYRLSVNYGETIDFSSVPTPVCQGFEFAGWADYYNNVIPSDSIATGSQEFYAKWLEVGFEITFDANGGSFSNGETTITGIYPVYNSLSERDYEVPVREGYEFSGWAEKPNGLAGNRYVYTTQNMTYYAVWQEPYSGYESSEEEQNNTYSNNSENENADYYQEEDFENSYINNSHEENYDNPYANNSSEEDMGNDQLIIFDNNENDNLISSNNCNYEITGSENVTAVSEDSDATSVVISDTISHKGKNYTVTEIRSNAFRNRTKLKSLVVGRNIQKIGSGAFSGCKNLGKITIRGNNLKSIGSGSFRGIKKGARITVVCKDKKTYNKLVKKLKKAGAKKAKFKFKKG